MRFFLLTLVACGPASPPTLDVFTEAYGSDPLQALDVYVPGGAEEAPVMVYVHGGGWAVGSRTNVGEKADWATRQGYVFVSVDYRLSPETPTLDPDRIKHPIQVDDVTSALRYVHDEATRWGGDPDRVGLLGHSAGAHLSALASLEPGRFASARCVFANDTEALDIPAAMAAGDDERKQTLVNAFGDDPAVWESASPIQYLASDSPPILLTRRGTASRHAVVNAFVERAEAVGASVEVIDAQELDHAGVNAAVGDPDDAIVTPTATRFFADCL